MKSVLTFTLAAGVAISTASVAYAEGAGRERASNAGAKAPAASLAPASAGVLSGFVLDRIALNRELSKLEDDLSPEDTTDDGIAPVKSTTKSVGTWTY